MSSELDSTSGRPHNGTDSLVYRQLTQCLVKPFKSEIDLKSIALNDIKISKYICDQCFDEFIHESSLTSHLERKSLRITYFCDKCKTNLFFFNRCALLSHIRSHNQNNEKIDQKLSKVVIQPIDLKHLFLKTDSNDKSIGDNCPELKKTPLDGTRKKSSLESTNCLTIGSHRKSIESNIETNKKIFEINRNDKRKTINSSNNSINTKFVIKKSSNSELKCTECKSSFNSLWTREQHLADRQIVIPLNQCRICPTICATNCSQSFHNKLHSNCEENDLFCPECGSKLDQKDSNQVLIHLIINCHHLSRRLVYNCMYCSEKMSSLSVYVQHIISSHTHQQCSHCPHITQTEDNMKTHQINDHSFESTSIAWMECPICNMKINSRNNYSIHLTTHRKKFFDFTSFAFICLECDQSFITKYDLKSHFSSFHIKDMTETEKDEYLKKLTNGTALRFKLKFDSTQEKSDKSKDQKSNDFDSKVNELKNRRNSNDKNIDSTDISAKRLRRESDNFKEEKTNDESNPQKPTNDNSFECCECGLKFPVVQTLKRHLILEHRIHDVESYINKSYIKVTVVPNEIQLPKEIGEEKLSKILDSKDSTDTLCPICSQRFSDSNELKIHGRVHGMAFIKSCQKKSLI